MTTTIHPASHSRLQRAAAALTAVSFLVAQAAQACPGCKQALGGDGAGGKYVYNGAGIGYAVSIGLMLFLVASVLGGLGYMMYRNCQLIAAQHQAAFGQRGRA